MARRTVKIEPFYSVNEVSEMLGFQPTTIYRMIKRGEIKATKFGKNYRISSDEVRRWKSTVFSMNIK